MSCLPFAFHVRNNAGCCVATLWIRTLTTTPSSRQCLTVHVRRESGSYVTCRKCSITYLSQTSAAFAVPQPDTSRLYKTTMMATMFLVNGPVRWSTSAWKALEGHCHWYGKPLPLLQVRGRCIQVQQASHTTV